MKALTLIQPWGWAIVHAGKRIENRTWRAPSKHYGQIIAIHAGQKYDALSALHIQEITGKRVPPEAEIERGAVIATAILVGVIDQAPMTPEWRRWWMGPFGWVLDHVVPVQPFSCPGMLGLWDLPDTIREHLVPLDTGLAATQAEAFFRGRVA